MTLKILLPAAALAARLAAAATLTVPAGGDLQGTLNAAQPGDTIQLAAGAQFVGHFYLPANPGSQTITIQSAAVNALPAGTRVSPGQSNLMAKLVTPDGAPALQMTTGANYYRIQGIEFAPAPGVYVQDMVQVGNGGENSNAALPHDLDFDRVYIHGDPGVGSKRGVALNGINVTVENSYITDFKSTWQDTQAIAGWNGPGPYRIINNELQGGAENVAFGGAVPSIPGNLPSDILIQNNHFMKPLSWQPGSSSFAGMAVWAKNHIELKFAQRVTIDGNTFENNWVGADQRGFILVFNVRCEQGAVPWAVVNNVTVSNNTIRHAAAGIVFVGEDSASNNAGMAGGFTVQNNTFADINQNWGGDGRLFQIQSRVQGLNMNHNTAFQAGYLLVFTGDPNSNVNFTNNIAEAGWGNSGDGIDNNQALATFMPGGSFLQNAIIGGNPANFPSSNYFPSSDSQVGFVDEANGNFQLSASSSFKSVGTDGKGLGSTILGPISTPSPITIAAPAPTPTATPVAPSPSAVPSGWVEIINSNSGSCVDVTALSGSELQVATRIQQYSCWGGANQQFQFTPVAGGYSVTSRASGLQLDVVYGSNDDGAPVIQYPFWGGANEVWSLVDAGSGYYTIHPSNSGKCLDVYALSTQNGAAIEQWSCNGGTNQQFKLVPVQ